MVKVHDLPFHDIMSLRASFKSVNLLRNYHCESETTNHDGSLSWRCIINIISRLGGKITILGEKVSFIFTNIPFPKHKFKHTTRLLSRRLTSQHNIWSRNEKRMHDCSRWFCFLYNRGWQMACGKTEQGVAVTTMVGHQVFARRPAGSWFCLYTCPQTGI